MTLTEILRTDPDLNTMQPHAPNAIVAADDQEFCEQSRCPACGATNRQYRPFISGSGNAYSYRCFAVCVKCSFCEEI